MNKQSPESAPRLAIVVPVFGHSVLVSEALQTALDQQADFGIHIVVVNDGCPHKETDLVLSAIAGHHSDHVTYLRKANGGLSSARNFAINHVLEYLPSVEAVFMLDADNRLRPQSMARAMTKLDETPEADWVYPSIDMFGIKARCDYGGPYSRLVHSEMNTCEAGSLVRRRVFEHGILFDESFKLGFEDWHFFLDAGDAGFRGVNLEEFGFFYRKRPESMLANADRNTGLLVGQIRQAHPELFHPVAQVRLEQTEAPRFAIYLTDEHVVLQTTDPELGEEISLADYEQLYWSSQTTPMKHRVPPFLLVTSRALLEELRGKGLLHWTLWRLEHAALDDGLAFVTQRTPTVAGEVGYHPVASEGKLKPDQAIAWIISMERLKDITKSDNPIEGLHDIVPKNTQVSAHAVMFEGSVPIVTQGLAPIVSVLHKSRYRSAGLRRWGWRQPSIQWRGKEHLITRKWFSDKPVYPRASADRHNIGVVVKSANDLSPDILEQITSGREGSVRVHLFVMQDKSATLEQPVQGHIESISFLGENDFDHLASRKLHFLGASLPATRHGVIDEIAMGMLYWLDELHNVGCPAASRLMGALRRFGVRTTLHLETHASEGSNEDLRLALAYEHSYDQLLVPDNKTSAYLCGMGVPYVKMKVLDT